MNVNDMIVQGAEPLFFLDYLGLHRQVPAQTVEIVKGVSAGCEQAQCALLGGECAEMPDIYAPGDFDIAGFAVGVVELDRVIDSNLVSKGDVIIGLASSGIHSNGYSLVRRIIKECRLDLEARYGGLEEYVDEDGHARSLGDILLTPTRIYVRPIVRLLRRYRVKRVITGMAHITGSGLPGNVCRALPEDLNARIDRSAWNTPAIFRFLGACGQVPDEEMWNVFNMGIGYVVFTRKTFANSVLRALRRLGEEATIIGSVVKGNGSVEWAE